MKLVHTLIRISLNTIVTLICLMSLTSSLAGDLGPTIDDFSDANTNSLGIGRQLIDDTSSGGSTQTEYSVKNGVISAKGQISPPRGQPGWASLVLLLDPKGLPRDASAYQGVRLSIRINKGNVSVSANSSDITNFDYHAMQIPRKGDGEFHMVEIPFKDMKRAWSPQTRLNTKTLTSLSVVAFDLQKGSFDFEIDEVSFY